MDLLYSIAQAGSGARAHYGLAGLAGLAGRLAGWLAGWVTKCRMQRADDDDDDETEIQILRSEAAYTTAHLPHATNRS